MNVGYEPIVWNDTLITGVEIIDEQHQILINMLNEANARMGESISRDTLETIVRDLMSYALYHFDTEEELMLEEEYTLADRERHFEEHRGFSKTVADVQLGLSQGKLISREELLGFLNSWLINHILKTDKQLGRFLNAA